MFYKFFINNLNYSISILGTPQHPNPPARIVSPLDTGFIASSKDFNLLNLLLNL